MKTAIIIDSTAYASREILEHPHIYEVKFRTTFADGFECVDSSDKKDLDFFYSKLQNESTLPTTSQPSPGPYMALVEEIIEKGYTELICIHLSAGLSGAYQTAKIITDDYNKEIKVKVIDSKGASVVIEAMIIQALNMLESNLDFEQICKNLTWIADNSMIYLTVSDLNNLVKGGRLNQSAAMVANMLSIKPLLCIGSDGKIQLLEKIRTDKRINRRLTELAQEAEENFPDGIMLGFAHAVDIERMKIAMETVAKALPNYQPITSALGPVIGSHTGAGAIGMGVIPIAKY
ncbi:MAG TPA: DegV family protein [Erysipelotrichaceae bacterium]|nr:DegV family protein [Erysipelotrichaceae bacterium]